MKVMKHLLEKLEISLYISHLPLCLKNTIVSLNVHKLPSVAIGILLVTRPNVTRMAISGLKVGEMTSLSHQAIQLDHLK
ncbi:hypothetical protein D3C79_944310 [compost metagenome]